MLILLDDYTVSAFHNNFVGFINCVNLCNNNPEFKMPSTRYPLYQKKAPKMKLKQKKQATSVALNNIVLSFQKATPINYDRNNLFTP